jgi:phosphodiesterase/alkaline phosphatase D-like protein
MKLSLAFLFISVLAVSIAAAQSDSSRGTGQNSAMSTQDQISNGPVAEYVSDSNCTIGWSTHASGTMIVRYGTDRTKMARTAAAVGGKDGRNYHAQLDNLTPNTRYFFQVFKAGDAISGIGTFQTVPQGDTPVTSKATIPQ